MSNGSQEDNSVSPQAILRISEVVKRLGVSRSTVWARMNPKSSRSDPDFPKPFNLHNNPSGKGAVGILEADLVSYIKICRARPNNH